MNRIAEVEVAEAQLRMAMLASDVTRLDELLSDGLLFTNQDGLRLSKADDIAAHRSGLLAITRIDLNGVPEIRLLGDTAIVCTTADVVGRYADHDFGGTVAYTRIWHRTDAGWRIEAAHCSAVAPTD